MEGPSRSSKDCSGCRKLEAEVASLREQLACLRRQVKDLQEQLDAQTRTTKRQAAPFGRSRKVDESKSDSTETVQTNKKPGRKAGHEAAHRKRPHKVDRTIDVPVGVCPDCHVPVEPTQTFEQFQTDIPPVTPVVTQFNVQVGSCPCCGQRVQGTHPEQTSQALGAAANTLGPRAVGLACELKYRLGIPFRKISDLFGGFFSLPFCAGGISRAAARLARRGRAVSDFIRLRLSLSAFVHADETSWYLGGSAWLHVFTSGDLVAFVVDRSRSREVAVGVLGKAYSGIVVCDGSPIYDIFETARCNGHPLARIKRLLEADVADTRGGLVDIRELLKSGLALRDRREELTDLGFQRKLTTLRNDLQDWIERHRDAADKEVARLARHLKKYETEFLRYLEDPRIPATNNAAEQILRFAVLLRKVGCGNRTPQGARTFEVLGSLAATFRRCGVDFIEWVSNLMHLGHPKLIPPQLLPPGCSLQISYN